MARLLHYAIARRGNFNTDTTLGKADRCHFSNPAFTFATYLKSRTILYESILIPLSSSKAVSTTCQILLSQGTCKPPKSLEISPWNHQEWGVSTSLKNSRCIWTSVHLCRWSSAAWDCRGQWAPCHQKAGQFWEETRGTVRPSLAQQPLRLPRAAKPPHINFPGAALWLCFISKGLVWNCHSSYMFSAGEVEGKQLGQEPLAPALLPKFMSHDKTPLGLFWTPLLIAPQPADPIPQIPNALVQLHSAFWGTAQWTWELHLGNGFFWSFTWFLFVFKPSSFFLDAVYCDQHLDRHSWGGSTRGNK